MNSILEIQLYEELYTISISGDYYKVSDVFEYYKERQDPIPTLNKLKKALTECRNTTSNLVIYLGDTTENAHERVSFLHELWLDCLAESQ